MPFVANFKPSKSGFHFSNSSFAEVPDIHISAPVIGDLRVGNASNGLCGGMAFAARDFFESKMTVPGGTVNPVAGDLFDYIVMRLFDSFNLDNPATGLPRYMQLMDPGMSDVSRANVMIAQEWPKVKADIDSGRLSPLALIEIKSLSPGDLGQNHQVLVYGYDLSGTHLTLHLYDPNQPDDDTVTLSLELALTKHPTTVTLTGGGTVYCFFQQLYRFEDAHTGFANAKRWKATLNATVQVGSFLITGGISWLLDEAIKLFAGNKPVLDWSELQGQTLPGNYHISATFDKSALTGTIQFALETDKNSPKKQVAFQFWDSVSSQFHNLFFANNFQPNKSPGAPQLQTAVAMPVPVGLVNTGCFEFDSQDNVGGLPGRYLLKGLNQKLVSGTKVTFSWKDLN